MNIKREDYLRNPSGTSSLSFYKSNRVFIPETTLILRDDEYQKGSFADYEDTRYFKLTHRLNDLERPSVPDGFALAERPLTDYIEHIKPCYGDEIYIDEDNAFIDLEVFQKDLLVMLIDDRGMPIASGIAVFDRKIKEGYLEWIQVSPEYRKRGLGSFVVKELLWRLKDRASFVTVAGKLDSPFDPMRLYKKCGFSEEVIWHVLHKKSD